MREQIYHCRRWRLISFDGLVLVFSLCGTSMGLLAQQSIINPVIEAQSVSGGSAAAQPQSLSSIAGTVRDIHGTAIPGLPVTLVGQNNTVERVVTADSAGAFTFAGLPAGTYRATIYAAGFEPAASAPIVLQAGERRDLLLMTMRISAKTTTVEVVATQNEVVEAQVKEEEKQRVLGFVPNFYTSYIWNAAPMKPKLKLQLALRSTLDPFTFAVAAGVAGAEQAHNTFPGYGRGWEGYAKRFGGSYADVVTRRMLSSAILPSVFHQDPRYFYRGSGSVRSRILYALVSTVICKGDNGRLQPNYSQVLGNFAAAGISNVYRSPVDRQAALTFRNGLIITGSGAIENLLREFFSRGLTPNVPAFANGKP